MLYRMLLVEWENDKKMSILKALEENYHCTPVWTEQGPYLEIETAQEDIYLFGDKLAEQLFEKIPEYAIRFHVVVYREAYNPIRSYDMYTMALGVQNGKPYSRLWLDQFILTVKDWLPWGRYHKLLPTK